MCSFYNPNVQSAYESDQKIFVKLEKMSLAEYSIVYSLADGFDILDLPDLNLKNQLFFEKFENLNQQQNLMYVDRFFPQVLADLALEVLLGNVGSLSDYIHAPKSFVVPDIDDEELYYNYKLKDFIEYLLYSDIALTKASSGNKNYEQFSLAKNILAEFGYCSLYERLKLYDYLMLNLQIRVSVVNSSLVENELVLRIKIGVE